MVDKNTATELMGSLAFTFIAGFGGLCLAVPLASVFAEVNATTFWPYAIAGFLVGAPIGLLAFRFRGRFMDESLEVQ